MFATLYLKACVVYIGLCITYSLYDRTCSSVRGSIFLKILPMRGVAHRELQILIPTTQETFSTTRKEVMPGKKIIMPFFQAEERGNLIQFGKNLVRNQGNTMPDGRHFEGEAMA